MTAHKHAALMALYAQDAMETEEPWTRWQTRENHHDTWKTLRGPTAWFSDFEYRRKPRTIRIGEYDVPEPVREALKICTRYWIASPEEPSFEHMYGWDNDMQDWLWLRRGLIHLTREAAELHGRALVALTEVKS